MECQRGGQTLAVDPPQDLPRDGMPFLPDEADIAAKAADSAQVSRWRSRLADLGCFTKALRSPSRGARIARMAVRGILVDRG